MTSDSSLRLRVVRCPACGGDSRYDATNPARPFCSLRCKSVDLGAWASERYRVAGASAAAAPLAGAAGEFEPDPHVHS